LIIHSFVHSAVCLTTGPWSLPKRVLHRVQSNASSFIVQYPLFSLRSPSSTFIFKVLNLLYTLQNGPCIISLLALALSSYWGIRCKNICLCAVFTLVYEVLHPKFFPAPYLHLIQHRLRFTSLRPC